MKVGLITYYGDNCGACLQAHALQNVINELGHNCDIINYNGVKDFPKPPMSTRIKNIKGPKDLFIKAYLKLSKKENTTSKGVYDKFRREKMRFSDEYYDSFNTLSLNPPNYDAFVCGSDQIWNPTFRQNTNNRAYYLDFVPSGKKRISYAPSIGTTNIPQECKVEMSELLNKIDYLSVREQEGSEVIKSVAELDAEVVLDPTLLLTRKYWDKIHSDVRIEGKYILTYLFGEMEYEYEFIKHMSQKLGVKVVAIPRNRKDLMSNHELVYDVGPAEFVNLIKNAEMVITDSFHATVFSLIFNTPFYSLLRNEIDHKYSMCSRLYSILNLVGLESRIITPSVKINEIKGHFDIDFIDVDKKLEKERSRCIEFLKNALEDNK